MTTLTNAIRFALDTGNTNKLRDLGNSSKDRTVRAAAHVLLMQYKGKTEESPIYVKCIKHLKSVGIPVDHCGMVEIARWADEQSYVLYVAMFNGQMFSVGRTEEDAIQRALDAQDSHGETVDRDKIQTLTVKGDKWAVQTWIDRVCYAFVVKQLEDSEQ